MKKITRLLFLAGALMFTAFSMAQTVVTGTVMDAEMAAPLPGANIVEKGTTNGVSSNFDGEFSIITQSTEGEIVISYVGYTKVVVKFSGSTSLGNITLTPRSEEHTSELQSREKLVCRLLLEKKNERINFHLD